MTLTFSHGSGSIGERPTRIPKGSYHFNEFSLLHKYRLVIDGAGGDPGLDLIPKTLEFLDLFFEILLVLLLLVGIGCIVDLLPSLLELLHAFRYFL